MNTKNTGEISILNRLKRGPVPMGLYGALGIIILIAIFINMTLGVNFFSPGNLLNVGRNYSMVAIAAMGQTFVIISGGLDLSVGSVISTSNVIAASYMTSNALIFPVVLLCLLMGAAVGLFNGFLVTKRKVPPFIATLGVSIIINGLRLIWTNGMPRGSIPENLKRFSTGSSLGIFPNLFLVFLVLAVLYSIILGRSGYGRRLYVIGNNPRVASLSGVKTDLEIIKAYVICSTAAALVGILLGGYTGLSDNWVGSGYDLDSIAYAVLGGAAIGGGSGTIAGTVVGGFIMLMITNLVLLASLPLESQLIIRGLVIITALYLSNRKK
ncbi:MAG: ABC transporter permease [Spirochaetales bacterium]|nr:ABC transporter permease [Spirochaetales bacterium]